MVSRRHHAEQFELLPRTSQDSLSSDNGDLDGYGSPQSSPTFLRKSVKQLFRLPFRPARSIYSKAFRQRRGSRGSRLRIFCWLFSALLSFIAVLILFTAAFRPSYSHPPEHYKALQKRCKDSKEQGRGNINNEKVFIAAALHDPKGSLVGKDWGKAVTELVELLGPSNIHLSVYENDADPEAKAALEDMAKKITCNSTLISEHLAFEDLPRLRLPSGNDRIKRIAFLAEVRNRALRALTADEAIPFDKLLFLNDVIFNPTDAVNLLFSTNQESGRAQYQAACATDFVNAFKFYDRFATRDLEGFESGIPFYPWFTDAGNAISRRDVMNQRDAVRVRSCWGGMVAFEAKWFLDTSLQDSSIEMRNSSNTFDSEIAPLRFRYEEDPFWDASECCLIHADLTYLSHGNDFLSDSGIFMNPFVRVAYDPSTLSWLPYTRRVERLYSLIHTILNRMVGIPYRNPRRLEKPGDDVEEKVWVPDEKAGGSDGKSRGSYQKLNRVAGPGRFCGVRRLMVLNENPKKGQKNWEEVSIPTVP